MAIADAAPGRRVLVALAALCFAHALYFTLRYASQLPLDQFGFRQTQTALTAYWIAQDGFSLAYETPVAGPPWSIPFEFPLYQALVAAASRALHVPLDIAGRVTSFVFLALTLVPARRITRSLGLAPAVFPVFAALLLSSPLYLYWGRGFMIETTAVFLAVAAIACFVEFRVDPTRWRAGLGFVLFMALAMLQKATTALPVLAVLALVEGAGWIAGYARVRRLPPACHVAAIVLAIALPLAAGVAWTLYTDQVKQLNPLGRELTSSALAAWNWGGLQDRLAAPLYRDVLWTRIVVRNLGGLLGLAALVAALSMRGDARARRVAGVALALGLLPLLLFSPLHIVHDYYQSGNLLFLLFALAVAVGDLLPARWPRLPVAALLAIALVASNLYWFRTLMLPDAQLRFTAASSRDVAVAEVLAVALPPDGQFVAFGNDWSSTFAYLAQRKSLGVAGLFPHIDEVFAQPERFVEPGKLGAVVSCPGGSAAPGNVALESWARDGRDWAVIPVADCIIALPATVVAAVRATATVRPEATGAQAPAGRVVATPCEGSLDVALPTADGTGLDVQGWTAVSAKDGRVPEQAWITVTSADASTGWYPATPELRPDVNEYFGRPDDPTRMGVRAVVLLEGLAGELVLGIARRVDGRLEACPMQLRVTVPAP